MLQLLFIIYDYYVRLLNFNFDQNLTKANFLDNSTDNLDGEMIFVLRGEKALGLLSRYEQIASVKYFKRHLMAYKYSNFIRKHTIF